MHRLLYIVMVGLPGSGKSTLAEAIVKQVTDNGGNIAYLSTDLYVESMAETLGISYNAAFNGCIKAATESMNRDRRWAIHNQMDIIHDQTNLSVGKRRSSLAYIPKEYEKIACVVRCDEVERQRRLSDRVGKTIPPNVDASMLASYVTPTLDEGFTTIINEVSPYVDEAMLGLLAAKTK